MTRIRRDFIKSKSNPRLLCNQNAVIGCSRHFHHLTTFHSIPQKTLSMSTACIYMYTLPFSQPTAQSKTNLLERGQTHIFNFLHCSLSRNPNLKYIKGSRQIHFSLSKNNIRMPNINSRETRKENYLRNLAINHTNNRMSGIAKIVQQYHINLNRYWKTKESDHYLEINSNIVCHIINLVYVQLSLRILQF